MKPQRLLPHEVTKLISSFVHIQKRTRLPFLETCYEAVVAYLLKEGHEIFTPSLRAREQRVLNDGLASEYLNALMQVTDAPAQMSEPEKAVLMLLASPEDRADALAKLLK